MDDFARNVARRFDKVDHELHRVNDRLDALHRGLFQVGGGIIAALVGIIVTQLWGLSQSRSKMLSYIG